MVDFDEMQSAWEQFGEAAGRCLQAITQSVGQIMEVMSPAIEAMWEAVWGAYREAGMPYGESDEGIHRWLREMGEIERLRMEAERLEAHHRGMAAFRQMVEERR